MTIAPIQVGTIVDLLKIIAVVVQAITLFVVFPTARRAVSKNVQSKDLLWLLFWADALNRLWFTLRGLPFHQDFNRPWEAESLALCYLFAIVVQALVIRAYLWGKQ